MINLTYSGSYVSCIGFQGWIAFRLNREGLRLKIDIGLKFLIWELLIVNTHIYILNFYFRFLFFIFYRNLHYSASCMLYSQDIIVYFIYAAKYAVCSRRFFAVSFRFWDPRTSRSGPVSFEANLVWNTWYRKVFLISSGSVLLALNYFLATRWRQISSRQF